MYLNLADIHLGTNVLGRGYRLALWLQGCIFDCQGCIAPEWKKIKKNNLVNIYKLAKWTLSQSNLDGITISGGEPLLQIENLLIYLKQIKEKKDLDILIFTGYTKKELENLLEYKELTKYVDNIISGRFDITKFNKKGLIASDNQEVLAFSERGKENKILYKTLERKEEIVIRSDSILYIGIPKVPYKFKEVKKLVFNRSKKN